MATVQIKGQMAAFHWSFHDADEVHWTFGQHYGPDNKPADCVCMFPHAFTVEMPDRVDIVAGLVNSLEAAKLKALADYQRTVADINERLSKLQAITHEA